MNALKAENKQGLKIGQVARKLNIAVETIRMYEREGLIVLEKTETGQRIFYEEDLHWLSCIRRLIKEEGLNIEGIRRLLALLPCWELRPCSIEERKQCPAFTGALKPCWTMKSDIPVSCRAENCRACAVYQNASNCENLKVLLYQIKHQLIKPVSETNE